MPGKHVEPSARNAPYDPFEAITMGKTLLQQVLEANVDTLQQKLEAYNKHKQDCQLMMKLLNWILMKMRFLHPFII